MPHLTSRAPVEGRVTSTPGQSFLARPLWRCWPPRLAWRYSGIEMARHAERHDPPCQCRAIVPAQMNRGLPWSPEHRCMHPAGSGGYCWQHEPAEQAPEPTIEGDTSDGG